MVTQATNSRLGIRGLAVTALVLYCMTAPGVALGARTLESFAKPAESVERVVQFAKGGNLGHKAWAHEECTTSPLRHASNGAETCSTRQPLVQKGEHGRHE